MAPFYSALGLLLIVVTFGLPIAWLVSEFRARRSIRVGLGVCALILNFAFAFLITSMADHFNHNAWYGFATKELIDATVSELDAGEQARVLSELKRLQAEFHPTYENNAGYDTLVNDTVSRLKGGPAATTSRATRPTPAPGRPSQ